MRVYWAPVSQEIDLGIGTSLRFGDDNFTNTYYGVTAAGSAGERVAHLQR